MVRHMLQEHPDINPTQAQFVWEQISKEPVAYIRQIKEAILIKESTAKSKNDPKHMTLNSKFEFNRCILADLGTKEPTSQEKCEEKEMVKLIEEA